MDHKELKEAIFDIFRKSKEAPKPQYKRIDSMLGGKMNLTADDFAQLDPNSDSEKLKAAFEEAYLRGNTDSRASLKTLLDTAPYNEMKDMVDLIDNAKGTANTNPNRQFGASNQPTVRRSGGGLFEEKLRMQMLAGIITESEYKAKLNEDAGEYNNFWKTFLDKEYSMANDEYGDKEIIDSYRNKTIASLDELVDNIADLDYDLTEEAGGYPGDFYGELKTKIKNVSDETNFPYENELISKLNQIPTYSSDYEEDGL